MQQTRGTDVKYLIHAAIVLILLLISTPTFAGTSLKDTIQARDNEWSAAFNAGDAAAIAAFYEEDAVLLAPGGAPILGRAAIGDALSGLFGVLQNLKLVAEEVRPAGDAYAIDIGRILYEVSVADGTRISFTGNYVVVWHRDEDGVWRLVSDIFNERHSEPIAE
jgi:uncharacterized protein (TIGR02246 family)